MDHDKHIEDFGLWLYDGDPRDAQRLDELELDEYDGN